MKTIGLIGGLSWESTLDYYRYLNRETQRRMGARHSAKILLYSVDFQEVEDFVNQGNMPGLTEMMKNAAVVLEKAGADVLMIGANTMHMLVPAIRSVMSLPIVHIAEATAEEIIKKGFTKVGLMGTKPTMEMDFYKRILAARGIETIIPEEEDRELIQKTIFDELFSGDFRESSRQSMLRIMDQLLQNGAQGVILGCTEIPLLVKQEHTQIPLFDTTYIHACAGIDFALG